VSAICRYASGAVNEITAMLTPPLLWREWTGRSWYNRLVGWARIRPESWLRRTPAELTRPRGPGKPPDEPESTSLMNDPAFWMLLVH
jgi:hypothetical protein